MARPKIHDDALKERLLDAAAGMVTRQGVSALSMRTLAAQAGTSTTAVYSLFGGRSELLQALYVQAFSGFGAAQEGVPVTDDPSADLLGLGRAYRCWALDHPHFYAIMFGGALVGIEPDERTLEHCRTTMDPLLSAVERGRAAGVLAHGSTQTLSLAIWAAVHGAVSLELTAGLMPFPRAVADAHYEAVLASILRGWSP